ncbi:MAG: sigma-70 family RNA polymerase sigma factor [Chloroflexi bacterium]|nr:sigma-70 family RNA polymerase sigma factor [Chloroflexota bacterium]
MNRPAADPPSDDPATIEERIIAHLNFARAVAARSIDPRCYGADREDLIAWGVLGLVQAAQRYRDDRGSSFCSYAARRVRGQILDALRERDPLTRSARRAFKAAREVNADLPSPVSEMSLDKCLDAGYEPRPSLALLPGARSPRDPRWPAVQREMRRLPALERRVLALSYGRAMTLKEIGRQVGLSESGVCRVRSRALKKVRRRCSLDACSSQGAPPPSTPGIHDGGTAA